MNSVNSLSKTLEEYIIKIITLLTVDEINIHRGIDWILVRLVWMLLSI